MECFPLSLLGAGLGNTAVLLLSRLSLSDQLLLLFYPNHWFLVGGAMAESSNAAGGQEKGGGSESEDSSTEGADRENGGLIFTGKTGEMGLQFF